MRVILTTQRLILRQFDTNDASELFQLNADPMVLQYTGDRAFEDIKDAYSFIKNYSDYEKNGFGRWAVVLTDTGQFLGWCGLKRHANGMVDIGFRFHRKYWNFGYATEAARASLLYGFNELKLDEIIGRAAQANFASVRVLEKLGMSYYKKASCDGIADAVWYRIQRS